MRSRDNQNPGRQVVPPEDKVLVILSSPPLSLARQTWKFLCTLRPQYCNHWSIYWNSSPESECLQQESGLSAEKQAREEERRLGVTGGKKDSFRGERESRLFPPLERKKEQGGEPAVHHSPVHVLFFTSSVHILLVYLTCNGDY